MPRRILQTYSHITFFLIKERSSPISLGIYLKWKPIIGHILKYISPMIDRMVFLESVDFEISFQFGLTEL